jgi:hypothetical protein
MSELGAATDLAEAIGRLKNDLTPLSRVLRSLDHDVSTDCSGLRLRLHYPAIRQARPMAETMIEAMSIYIAHYCLPKREIDAVYAKKGQLPTFEFHAEMSRLDAEARRLFQKVRSNPDRTGEAGELILYLLTEWILEAPQIIAKMSLKMNPNVPAHGADGVHARFDRESGKLLVYSGEAKLHQKVHAAIASAVDSISNAFDYDAHKHELKLVQRNVDFSGLDKPAREALIDFLDPYSDACDDRVDIVTCLIGFDFSGYSDLEPHGDNAEEIFRKKALESLDFLGPKMAGALKDAGLGSKKVELFLLPLPSVQELRDRFRRLVGGGA